MDSSRECLPRSFKAQGTGHRAQGTGLRAQGSEHREKNGARHAETKKRRDRGMKRRLFRTNPLLGGVGVGSGSEHRLQYEVTARPQDTVRVELITNPDSRFLQ